MTYNIHNHLTETDREVLVAHLARIKPGLVVVMDDPHLARRIHAASPNTRVVYRKYLGDHTHLRMTPQQWVATYQAELPASEGVYWYCNNEPGFSLELVQWLTDVARLVLQANGRACLGNWSVGTPEPNDWLRAKDLLKLCGDNPARLMIGLHEYAPTWVGREFGMEYNPSSWPEKISGASYLLSRYRYIFRACDTLGVRRPKIAITEWGFDRIHAVGEWQQSLPRTPGQDLIGPLWGNLSAWDSMKPPSMAWPEYMVKQLAWAWRAIYRHDPEIVGTALFCWGADPGSAWKAFDFRSVPDIIPLMEGVNWTMNSIPPKPVGTHWVANMNVREKPSPTATIKGGIKVGTPVPFVTLSNVQEVDGYLWTPVPGGYAAVANLKTGELYVRA